FDEDSGSVEKSADKYAEDMLIPQVEYEEFVNKNRFDVSHIIEFANRIQRDPGIVLGRLQNDYYVRYDDKSVKELKHKYKVTMGENN
nr:addiction module antidote protein, HigA family [Lachnospiraceae bacterium]